MCVGLSFYLNSAKEGEDLMHLVTSCLRYRLMSGYKDRGNEGLGPRRASFPKCWKAGQRAEVSFGKRGVWDAIVGWKELW